MITYELKYEKYIAYNNWSCFKYKIDIWDEII
jgi:hypothetical protein